MKNCVSTYPLQAHYSDKEMLQIVADAGFGGIDYNLDTYSDANFAYTHPLDEVLDYYRDIKAFADKVGVEIAQTHAPFRYDDTVPNADEMHFAAIERAIAISGVLGAKYIVIHPKWLTQYRGSILYKKVRMERNVEFYRSLIPKLESANVICAIENMFAGSSFMGRIIQTACSTGEEIVRYITALDSPCFCSCCDNGHFNLLFRDYGRHAIGVLGETLGCVHLHDNDGTHDNHWQPFDGTIDFDVVMCALKNARYSGDVNMECSAVVVNWDDLKEVKKAYKELRIIGDKLVAKLQ